MHRDAVRANNRCRSYSRLDWAKGSGMFVTDHRVQYPRGFRKTSIDTTPTGRLSMEVFLKPRGTVGSSSREYRHFPRYVSWKVVTGMINNVRSHVTQIWVTRRSLTWRYWISRRLRQ